MSPEAEEDADLVVVLRLANDRLGTAGERKAIERLGDELADALSGAEAGDYEGDEIGGGVCRLFFATDDREKTLAVVRPLIARSRFGPGARYP